MLQPASRHAWHATARMLRERTTYPRLAGQHVQYLMKQLRSFQNNLRNVAVMHGVAQGLKVHDMLAVSAYLQSLD